jgi:hypothetical protein
MFAGQIGKVWTRCLCNDGDLILGESVVSSFIHTLMANARGSTFHPRRLYLPCKAGVGCGQ